MFSQEIETFLNGLGMFGWRLGLDRIHSILNVLGRPHEKFQSVHIAGSNGKGSTAGILESIFCAAGWHTGLYTSPHLISPVERIRVSGQIVAAQMFEQVLRELIPVFQKYEATYFEVMTALALELFSRSRCEIAILETGLGGRLDATNVVQPLCSAITSISLEHEQHLGESEEQIAAEKAGIIKTGVPCIVGDITGPALAAIQKRCAEQRSDLIRAGDRVKIRILQESFAGTTVSITGNGGEKLRVRFGLAGRHQVSNLRVALSVCERVFGSGTYLRFLPDALPAIKIPGRFEFVSRRPDVLLDVAHNPASFRALFESLQRYNPGKQFLCIIGLLKDKNLESILGCLAEQPLRLYCVTPASERALAAEVLCRHAQKMGIASRVFAALPEAIQAATSACGGNDLIVVTGSHYIVGEYKRMAQSNSLPLQPEQGEPP